MSVSALAAILDKLSGSFRAVGVFVNEPRGVVESVVATRRASLPGLRDRS
jgi:hypothetical protein